MTKSVAVLFYLLCAVSAAAQSNVAKKDWGAGINAEGGLSYTGYNISLLPTLSYGRHTLYAGPKLAMTSSYFPYKNNWGLAVGYNVSLISNTHWSAGLGLDYQCSFYHPFNPYNRATDHAYNKIHELFLAASIGYKPVKDGRLMLQLKLGTGGFLERYDNVGEGGTLTNAGRTSLASLGIGYKIL